MAGKRGINSDKTKVLCDYCRHCLIEYDCDELSGEGWHTLECTSERHHYCFEPNKPVSRQKCSDFEPLDIAYHYEKLEDIYVSHMVSVNEVELHLESIICDLKDKKEVDVKRLCCDIIQLLKTSHSDTEEENQKVERNFLSNCEMMYEYRKTNK